MRKRKGSIYQSGGTSTGYSAMRGVVDIQVDAIIHVFPTGHERRSFPYGLIGNVRDKLVGGGFIKREDLERDIEALENHLSRPGVQVTSNLFFRLTGRLPQ
ncbi:hypothetical protein AS156_14880 [Bradyrhizobium macuxiense]|uniref:Uncharacterized protein n=1 Tax=Bradyrhizobium macuxiense TaxID=1755647 RepID=A0A109JJ13_9BRAD|nr:hypothetical protein [Bradyrhizobium macuxiense]KWV49818.1 hypothetical protein AS156_14880 [Bradyrhizobium macuxiense]